MKVYRNNQELILGKDYTIVDGAIHLLTSYTNNFGMWEQLKPEYFAMPYKSPLNDEN